jgi:hypothetical protein
MYHVTGICELKHSELFIVHSMSECYVQLMGGLGNQLFQIAAGISHSTRTGRRLIVSEGTEGGRPTYWNSFLENCAKFIGPNNAINTWNEPHFYYKEIPESADGLRGYFQSSQHFKDVSSHIRILFTPSVEIQKTVQDKYGATLLTDEYREHGVVVHVRRGDYVLPEKIPYHFVTTPSYFERACSEMKEKDPAAKFLVFSEDLDWCRAQPYFADAIFVDEPDECVALHLMSHYKHYIISNSSFSWWATWLHTPAEVVYAPDRWFGPFNVQDWRDVYEPGWIKIPVN